MTGLEHVLYEQCNRCHLFIEHDDNGYAHLHRGDVADEALDESHEAEPSGKIHTLAWWRINGPQAMKDRFYRRSTT